MNDFTHADGGAARVASVRAFFAIWPDAACRNALAALARAVATQAGGRAPLAANLHVTLAFVGEVEATRIGVLCSLGEAVSATARPFQLTLDHVGTFRGSGIAWAGASDVPAELARLAADLNTALAAAGFATDSRPFQAHVTLARRCRRPMRWRIDAPIAWPVTRLVLNASDLAPGGPRYRVLAEWTFGEAGIAVSEVGPQGA